ncbi:hypothetical protein CLF_104614 [Clonorchis sinensis]|uniref:Uncharacterized protein n=1 Tax=Clonorchis sinensis TaxID=79923 RepID=G7YNW8_CLOSI|nr:hypothetical protein CLF_104614 [Clonorchis sinensis]
MDALDSHPAGIGYQKADETQQYLVEKFQSVTNNQFLSLSASNAQLTTPPFQIFGERNCGRYNHYTTSTRFLPLIMMMMMIYSSTHRFQEAQKLPNRRIKRQEFVIFLKTRLTTSKYFAERPTTTRKTRLYSAGSTCKKVASAISVYVLCKMLYDERRISPWLSFFYQVLRVKLMITLPYMRLSRLSFRSVFEKDRLVS